MHCHCFVCSVLLVAAVLDAAGKNTGFIILSFDWSTGTNHWWNAKFDLLDGRAMASFIDPQSRDCANFDPLRCQPYLSRATICSRAANRPTCKYGVGLVRRLGSRLAIQALPIPAARVDGSHREIFS
jgi:hypothetical protein